jgi:hypothetical protein
MTAKTIEPDDLDPGEDRTLRLAEKMSAAADY